MSLFLGCNLVVMRMKPSREIFLSYGGGGGDLDGPGDELPSVWASWGLTVSVFVWISTLLYREFQILNVYTRR